jgi:hypothetical protein
MRQVRVTRQHRTADARRRRQREPVLLLDPRDHDVVHAKHRLRGMGKRAASSGGVPAERVDWTAFVLAFKGVLPEGLEVGR